MSAEVAQPATKTTPLRTKTAPGAIPDTNGVVMKYEDIRGRKKFYMFSEEIDGSILEAYMADEEFEKVFSISKAEFYAKPKWRQNEMLKKVELF